jgi:hypothetical protein
MTKERELREIERLKRDEKIIAQRLAHRSDRPDSEALNILNVVFALGGGITFLCLAYLFLSNIVLAVIFGIIGFVAIIGDLIFFVAYMTKRKYHVVVDEYPKDMYVITSERLLIIKDLASADDDLENKDTESISYSNIFDCSFGKEYIVINTLSKKPTLLYVADAEDFSNHLREALEEYRKQKGPLVW